MFAVPASAAPAPGFVQQPSQAQQQMFQYGKQLYVMTSSGFALVLAQGGAQPAAVDGTLAAHTAVAASPAAGPAAVASAAGVVAFGQRATSAPAVVGAGAQVLYGQVQAQHMHQLAAQSHPSPAPMQLQAPVQAVSAAAGMPA
ncbi:MAG: hypothetical protein ACK4KW_15270, partial [Gemmobacter sp.]